MTGTIVAIVFWITSELVIGIAWFMTQARFLADYRAHFGGYSSTSENMRDAARDPIGLLRRTPREWIRKWSAQTTPVADPDLERRRGRLWRLYVLLAAWSFLGLPASLLLVAMARGVAAGLGLK